MQARGRRFDPVRLHQTRLAGKNAGPGPNRRHFRFGCADGWFDPVRLHQPRAHSSLDLEIREPGLAGSCVLFDSVDRNFLVRGLVLLGRSAHAGRSGSMRHSCRVLKSSLTFFASWERSWLLSSLCFCKATVEDLRALLLQSAGGNCSLDVTRFRWIKRFKGIW